jgi:exodeoxyribonuclease VII small subunit
MAKDKPIETLTYEEAFAELEAIVASLEAGDQSLDESTSVYARGQALVKRCAELLEKAELKVRSLTDDGVEDFEVPA